jgi:hypothetical protein
MLRDAITNAPDDHILESCGVIEVLQARLGSKLVNCGADVE